MKGRNIRGWNYFTNQIAQFKATRIAGMPIVIPRGTSANSVTFKPQTEVAPEIRAESLRSKKERGMHLNEDEEAFLAEHPAPNTEAEAAVNL